MIHQPSTIQALRKHLRLTQSQFSTLLGVHAMTVSKWERGTTGPAPYNEQQLAAIVAGIKCMDADHHKKFTRLVATGSGVKPLAYLINLGLTNPPS